MAVEDDKRSPPENVMDALLTAVREEYIDEHGEEPPADFMRKAEKKIVHGFASRDREDHREIYEALAKE